MFAVINNWGATGAGIAEDVNNDLVVNIDDLFFIVNNWGPYCI